MEHYKNFSRLPDPILGKVVLTEFFDSLIRLVSKDAGKQGIRIESEVQAPGLSIRVDHNLFEQAFINLIGNSSEALAGQKDGLIRLSAYREKEHLVNLRISDNGPGIPEEIRSQIFIPFFTTKRGGSGIGMSIVRKIVIACGGSIDLDNVEEGGTTFVIKLPELIHTIQGKE